MSKVLKNERFAMSKNLVVLKGLTNAKEDVNA